MSLPTPWVDRIFDKLTLIYGQAFLRRWQDIDLNAVKSDWAHELAGFAQHPRAIAFALENLPIDKPPTVLEFRAMARRVPAAEVPRLEAPPADPERVAKELAKLAPMRQQMAPTVDRLAWAKRIQAKHLAGEKLALGTLRIAQDALRMNGLLREPEKDETPLSTSEVEYGVSRGHIPTVAA